MGPAAFSRSGWAVVRTDWDEGTRVRDSCGEVDWGVWRPETACAGSFSILREGRGPESEPFRL